MANPIFVDWRIDFNDVSAMIYSRRQKAVAVPALMSVNLRTQRPAVIFLKK